MKRTLSLALVLTLILSLAAPAFAAGEPRHTDFFTDREHADMDFADMKYEPVDVDAFQAKADTIRALSRRTENLDAVREGILELCGQLCVAETMCNLAYIYTSQDVHDAQAEADYQEADLDYNKLNDSFILLLRDVVNSPCSVALDELLSQEDQETLKDYTPMTQEEEDLTRRINGLTAEFWRADGKEYASNEEKNQIMGKIYLELLPLYQRRAQIAGYGSYADYAYENLFTRDYTSEDAKAFHKAVKEYIAPLFQDVNALYMAELYRDVFWDNYAGEIALDQMAPYLPLLSDELVESFDYMRRHGLYDIEAREGKAAQGYTTDLRSYGSAFFYNDPSDGFYDMTTAIHEFGHYNQTYWNTTADPFPATLSYDAAEVHSQALECLFTHFYPQMFGVEDAPALELYILRNMLNAIVSGSIQDEIQQYAFATKDVTLEQINTEYRRLAEEYDMVAPDDPRTEMVGWSFIPHSFETPFYYLSYATSAAGALAFWLESQKDYYTGVDKYLEFTALGNDPGFTESFEAVGMESPMTPHFLRELALTLRASLDVDNRLTSLPVVGYFRDVEEDDWFLDGVAFVYANELMEGIHPTVFAPLGEMTRGQLVTILYRHAGSPEAEAASFADVEGGQWYTDGVNWAVANGIANGYGGAESGYFGPNDPVTREQLVTIFYRYAQYAEANVSARADLAGYADVDTAAGYALPALSWAVKVGLLTSTGTGGDLALSPQRTATRAETSVLLLRFLAADEEESAGN